MNVTGEDIVSSLGDVTDAIDKLRKLTPSAEAIRSQRHHEVFLEMLKATFKGGPTAFARELEEDGSKWRAADIEACRSVADLAYPKPEVKP